MSIDQIYSSERNHFTALPDTDGDGISDDQDAFPNNPNEWLDSDGDGVSDNSDALPDDPNEWLS